VTLSLLASKGDKIILSFTKIVLPFIPAHKAGYCGSFRKLICMGTFYSVGYLRLDISFPFLWEGICYSTIPIIKYSIILSDYIFLLISGIFFAFYSCSHMEVIIRRNRKFNPFNGRDYPVILREIALPV
jgi:hypothetical protein